MERLVISTAAVLRPLRRGRGGSRQNPTQAERLDIVISWQDEEGRVSWASAAGDVMALAAGQRLEREGGVEIRIWEGPAVYTVTQFALLLETGDPDGVVW